MKSDYVICDKIGGWVFAGGGVLLLIAVFFSNGSGRILLPIMAMLCATNLNIISTRSLLRKLIHEQTEKREE